MRENTVRSIGEPEIPRSEPSKIAAVPSARHVLLVSGRVKVRLIVLFLVSPWWFEWPMTGDFYISLGLITLLGLVPWLASFMPENASRAFELLVQGVVLTFFGLLHWGPGGTVFAVFLISASPGDTIFVVVLSAWCRVIFGLFFALIAMVFGQFVSMPWHTVLVRGFFVGVEAGSAIVDHLYHQTVLLWVDNYGRGLYRLLKRS